VYIQNCFANKFHSKHDLLPKDVVRKQGRHIMLEYDLNKIAKISKKYSNKYLRNNEFKNANIFFE